MPAQAFLPAPTASRSRSRALSLSLAFSLKIDWHKSAPFARHAHCARARVRAPLAHAHKRLEVFMGFVIDRATCGDAWFCARFNLESDWNGRERANAQHYGSRKSVWARRAKRVLWRAHTHTHKNPVSTFLIDSEHTHKYSYFIIRERTPYLGRSPVCVPHARDSD